MIRESMRGSTVALRVAFLCVGVSGLVSFVASFRGLTNLASVEAQWGWMSPGLSLIVDVLTVAGAALIIAMAIDRVGRLFGWALFLLADAASIAGNWYDAAKVRDLQVGGIAVNVAPPIALALCLKGGEMAWRRLRKRRVEAGVVLGEQEYRREIAQRRLDLEEYERRTRVDAQIQAELLPAQTAAGQVTALSRPDGAAGVIRPGESSSARRAIRLPDAAPATAVGVPTPAVSTSDGVTLPVAPSVLSWIRDIATSGGPIDVRTPEAVRTVEHYAPSRVGTPDAWVGVAVALVVSGGLSVPKATQLVGHGPGAGVGLPGREKKVHRAVVAYRHRLGKTGADSRGTGPAGPVASAAGAPRRSGRGSGRW